MYIYIIYIYIHVEGLVVTVKYTKTNPARFGEKGPLRTVKLDPGICGEEGSTTLDIQSYLLRFGVLGICF